MRPKRAKELTDILKFVEFTNRFKAIERLIWYKGVDRQECDGEHTFQLTILAWFVNERCELGLDPVSVFKKALVHDLVETYANDTPAFVSNGNGAETPCREEKATRERVAKLRIKREFGKIFPDLVQEIEEYDAQKDEVCRFIYALDKFLAEANVTTDHGRSNHKIGVTLETMDLYKRPRVSRHPVVLELYDELFKRLLREKDTLFPSFAKEKEPVS